jgi:hypothetical protein
MTSRNLAIASLVFAANLAHGQTKPMTIPYQQGVGVGLDLPDVFPVEYVGWYEYFGWRAFVSAPYSFNVRVEMPDDVLSNAKGIEVSHDALDFTLKATYGSNYGMEVFAFPFGGSFFGAAGVSYRQFRLRGEVLAPLHIRVQGSEYRATTKTEFGARADAKTEALLARVQMGWIFRVLDQGYAKISLLGVAKPIFSRSTVIADAIIDAPGEENDDVAGALFELKKLKEDEMQGKALQEIRPVESKLMPVIGVTVGYLF